MLFGLYSRGYIWASDTRPQAGGRMVSGGRIAQRGERVTTRPPAWHTSKAVMSDKQEAKLTAEVRAAAPAVRAHERGQQFREFCDWSEFYFLPP